MSSVYGQTLLDDMVQSQGLPMPLVKQAAREILEVIREGLVRDGVVNVSNFGTFRLKLAAARNGYNPQTRERITIPAHQRVIFSPCKALRELIQPVHKPPIPIAEERGETRTAARSADIATAGAVATKTIVPPAQPVAETEESAEEESSLPADVTSERRVTPDRRHSTSPQQPEATETQPAPPQEPDEKARPVDLEESVDEIRLEIGEEASRSGQSRNKLVLGAAAVIVIAAVAASLMFDSTGEEKAVPVASAPASPSAKLLTELATKSQPSAVVPSPAAETTEAEEADSSMQHAEMQKAQTAEIESLPKPAVEETSAAETLSPAPSTATTTGDTSAQLASAEPATTAGSKPTSFFFTEKTHKISNGESLWRLARSHYQDPLLWPHIYQANAAVITNPDSLSTGSTITIPSLQGEPGKLTKTDRRNIAEGYYLTYLYYKENGHKDAFFALLEAKRYDNKVVEEHRSLLKLSQLEEIMLGQQETMPF